MLVQGRVPEGRLIKVIVLDRDGTGWGLPAHAMGAVLRSPAHPHPDVAYVFLPVIARLLGSVGHSLEDLTDREVGRALGRIVAHELVHVLAPDHPHRRSGIMAAAVHRDQLLARTARLDGATATALPVAAAQQPAPRAAVVERAPVSVFEGESMLKRSFNKVRVRFITEAKPGAYTVWGVIFNNPDACATSPCSADDLGVPDVNASVVFAAGGIVGNNRVGRFSGTVMEGDVSGALFGPGLIDADTAEIHFVLRDHGPVIPGLEDEMTTTFNGGCQTEDNPDPALNPPCRDVQFSVHAP